MKLDIPPPKQQLRYRAPSPMSPNGTGPLTTLKRKLSGELSTLQRKLSETRGELVAMRRKSSFSSQIVAVVCLIVTLFFAALGLVWAIQSLTSPSFPSSPSSPSSSSSVFVVPAPDKSTAAHIPEAPKAPWLGRDQIILSNDDEPQSPGHQSLNGVHDGDGGNDENGNSDSGDSGDSGGDCSDGGDGGDGGDCNLTGKNVAKLHNNQDNDAQKSDNDSDQNEQGNDHGHYQNRADDNTNVPVAAATAEAVPSKAVPVPLPRPVPVPVSTAKSVPSKAERKKTVKPIPAPVPVVTATTVPLKAKKVVKPVPIPTAKALPPKAETYPVYLDVPEPFGVVKQDRQREQKGDKEKEENLFRNAALSQINVEEGGDQAVSEMRERLARSQHNLEERVVDEQAEIDDNQEKWINAKEHQQQAHAHHEKLIVDLHRLQRQEKELRKKQEELEETIHRLNHLKNENYELFQKEREIKDSIKWEEEEEVWYHDEQLAAEETLDVLLPRFDHDQQLLEAFNEQQLLDQASDLVKIQQMTNDKHHNAKN